MNKIKIMTIFGVRPEAIKLAPVIKELEKYSDRVEPIVAVTGQHREMLDQVLDLFSIKADYDLDIMKPKQTLTDIFVRALRGLEEVLQQVQPDMILVHGDTSTCFIGSLAAFYQKIPVGHVEAGLRTFQKYFPYPEEMNRRLTGVLADLHFAPTAIARDNLLREGVKADTIFVTGNTVIDALKYTVKKDYNFKNTALKETPWRQGRMILMEVHRRENLGEPIRNVCQAAKKLLENDPDLWLVFPVHMNPLVRDDVFAILKDVPRAILCEPLDTDDFHNLMAEAYFMISDSGGVQEEAPALGTPVLVTRTVTERPEAVQAGTVAVIGTELKNIVARAEELLYQESVYLKMAKAINPYGDGFASARIAAAILNYFGVAADNISF